MRALRFARRVIFRGPFAIKADSEVCIMADAVFMWWVLPLYRAARLAVQSELALGKFVWREARVG